jgi:putative thioredoxin
MAASPWIIDVAEADFVRDVIDRSREVPVVVDFWSPSCQPCRVLGPLLERLAQERAGAFVLAKVDLDHAPNLAMHFGIQAVPTVQAFRDGKAVDVFVGLLPEGQLREFLDRICPSEADKLVREAKNLETKSPEGAERLYRQALVKEPDHGGAMAGLAHILIGRNRDEEAEKLLGKIRVGGDVGEDVERLEHLLALRRLGRGLGSEADARRRLEAEPNNAQRHYELGCILAAAGRYVEALQSLLAAAERDPALARGQAREAMVEIFHVIGVRDPLADEYRNKLARLLY